MVTGIMAVLGILAALSLGLTLWQTWAAWRFPLHQRLPSTAPLPPVTLLKPLKGIEPDTLRCLRSWLTQDYAGEVQVLFGVADKKDPVCAIVQQLLAAHPHVKAELILCPASLGANAKVSTLIQLQSRALHSLFVISDADVWAPPDLLANLAGSCHEPEVGLINCFYCLANPSTPAMRWEAVAINADFWSQVLQGLCLWPMDYALGAVMATTREYVNRIGGFTAIADYLADDYQLGNLIARQGARIDVSPIVVECWSSPMTWRQVWRHQLRWARTIRFCQPWPYAWSLLGNATLWPLLWLAAAPQWPVLLVFLACLGVRIITAYSLQWRIKPTAASLRYAWLPPVKDLLQFALWLTSWTSTYIEWRGECFSIARGGKMIKANRSQPLVTCSR